MTQAAGLAGYASSLPNFRNRIINGDMRIDQRNAGSAVNLTSNQYVIDRWENHLYTPGSRVGTIQKISTDSPLGLSSSMKLTCTNSSGTQDANEQFYIEQQIEGNNISNFTWYNSSPSALTLSFYVKSNLTGTFPLSIKLSDNNSDHGSPSSRILPLKYEINDANTWERKTVTFTLDTYSGTKIISNTFAMSILFWLAAGSSRRGCVYNVWRTNPNAATSGLDNYTFLDNTSNEFYLTGVQLEEGTVATPFEHRPYGLELSFCQRYYQARSGTEINAARAYASDVAVRMNVFLINPMRANPSVTLIGSTGWSAGGSPGGITNDYFRISGNSSSEAYITGYTANAEL